MASTKKSHESNFELLPKFLNKGFLYFFGDTNESNILIAAFSIFMVFKI